MNPGKCHLFVSGNKHEQMWAKIDDAKIWESKTVKVGLSPSKKIFVICLIENLLKMMKNAFYFIIKANFVLQIFKFLSRLFGYIRKTA